MSAASYCARRAPRTAVSYGRSSAGAPALPRLRGPVTSPRLLAEELSLEEAPHLGGARCRSPRPERVGISTAALSWRRPAPSSVSS